MSFRVHSPRVPSSIPINMGRTLALRRGRAQWTTVVGSALVLLALPSVLRYSGFTFSTAASSR